MMLIEPTAKRLISVTAAAKFRQQNCTQIPQKRKEAYICGYENSSKKDISRRTGTGGSGACQQLWRCADAVLWGGNLRHFQRSLRFFRGVPGADAGHMDLSLSGSTGVEPYGAPAVVCALLSLQLCSGLCVWRTAGYPRGLDRPSSHGAAI